MGSLKVLLVFIALLAGMDRLAAKAGHGMGCLPGSPHNISKDDQGLLKALLITIYSFNNQSNDAFLFRARAIEKAQRQVIKGIRYIMEVQLSRTVCHKAEARELKDCGFQPEGPLHQTLSCHCEVWELPWLRVTKPTFSCRPSREKSSTPPLSSRSAHSVNES